MTNIYHDVGYRTGKCPTDVAMQLTLFLIGDAQGKGLTLNSSASWFGFWVEGSGLTTPNPKP